MFDDDRHFCDALECGDWRPAFFQELPWLHDVQDGLRHAGGVVDRDRAYDSSFHHSVGSGETSATLVEVSLLARLRRRSGARNLGPTLSGQMRRSEWHKLSTESHRMWSNSANECWTWNAAFPHWRASQRMRLLHLPHLRPLRGPNRGLQRRGSSRHRT